MTGYYTGKVELGKVFTCKTCGKTPNVGDERFYEKKGDTWLGCTDKQCFIQQGGSTEEANKAGAGGKFQRTKFPIADVPKVYELAETILESFMKKRKDPDKFDLTIDQQAIFVESLFRTISSNFKPES